MIRSILILASCCLALLHGGTVFAYTSTLDGGATETVTNGWHIPATDIIVGAATATNAVLVTSTGSVSNNSTFVGFGAGADTNRVKLSGASAAWASSGNFEVGSEGSYNSLLVDSGAVLTSGSGYVGREASAMGNSAVISGPNSRWSNSSYMRVGHQGSSNTLVVANGARLENGAAVDMGLETGASANRALVTGTNSVWSSGQRFAVGFAGHNNSLRVEDGGRVEADGLYVGHQGTAVGNMATVTGKGSVLVSSSLAVVGWHGSSNALLVADGGRVEVPTLVVGMENGARDNRVVVGGAGSMLEVDGNLMLGGYFLPGGTGNMLILQEGGRVSAAAVENRNGSTIQLEPDTKVSTDAYYQDASSSLKLMADRDDAGKAINGWIDVAGTAEFEAGATIEIASHIGRLEFNRYYTNTIVAAQRLIVGATTNATTPDLSMLNAYGSLVYVDFMERNQDILVQYSRQRLAEIAGFADGTDMASVADEIDHAGLSGNDVADTQIGILNQMDGDEQAKQLRQLYERGIPTYRHQEAMKEGMTSFLERSKVFRQAQDAESTPEGAAGPHTAFHDGMWVKIHQSSGNQDATGRFSAFDSGTLGMVLGYDKAVGAGVLGAAIGFADSTILPDDGDSSDADMTYAMLYGSWATDDWYCDLGFAAGCSDIKTESGTVFDTSADFSAYNYSAYAGGGKEMHTKGNLHIAPELAIHAGWFDQSSYTESSNTALARNVDGYDRWSVQSILGANLRWDSGANKPKLNPRARVFWIHEFNDDDDELNYKIVGGGQDHTMFIQGMDADMLRIGVGLVASTMEGWELAFDVDGYCGNTYNSVVISGRLMYEF